MHHMTRSDISNTDAVGTSKLFRRFVRDYISIYLPVIPNLLLFAANHEMFQSEPVIVLLHFYINLAYGNDYPNCFFDQSQISVVKERINNIFLIRIIYLLSIATSIADGLPRKNSCKPFNRELLLLLVTASLFTVFTPCQNSSLRKQLVPEKIAIDLNVAESHHLQTHGEQCR